MARQSGGVQGQVMAGKVVVRGGGKKGVNLTDARAWVLL